MTATTNFTVDFFIAAVCLVACVYILKEFLIKNGLVCTLDWFNSWSARFGPRKFTKKVLNSEKKYTQHKATYYI